MSAPTTDRSDASFAADSLALGMLVMLAMSVVQRGIGFFRGIWICRLLDDTLVGQWAMALGFITLITPVMMLGIPGSLPRYVEHYRMRGHLSAFVRRMAWLTLTCTTVFVLFALIFPQALGWFVFLEPQNESLVHSVGLAVVAISAFYFVNELVTALRQVRIVSLMQFVQSLAFTLFAIVAIYAGYGLIGVVISYAVATMIALVPGLAVLLRGWGGLSGSDEPFCAPSMWRRILPYAGALWALNLLTNVFALSDRYMILHFTPGGEIAGQAAVGQYHSGRMLPVLLMSLASLIGGILMPYLCADWEVGRRQVVRDRLRRALFAMSALFTVGAAVGMLAAPYMFDTLLQSRYSAGLSVMPIAFVFCTWVSLVTVAENYLLVAERGKLVALVVAVGLVVNLALNACLLPLWGLHGAVIATLAAHGIVMLGIWAAMALTGFDWDRTLVFVTLMPATLLAGPLAAICCVVVTLVTSPQAKSWVVEAIRALRGKRDFATAAP